MSLSILLSTPSLFLPHPLALRLPPRGLIRFSRLVPQPQNSSNDYHTKGIRTGELLHTRGQTLPFSLNELDMDEIKSSPTEGQFGFQNSERISVFRDPYK